MVVIERTSDPVGEDRRWSSKKTDLGMILFKEIAPDFPRKPKKVTITEYDKTLSKGYQKNSPEHIRPVGYVGYVGYVGRVGHLAWRHL